LKIQLVDDTQYEKAPGDLQSKNASFLARRKFKIIMNMDGPNGFKIKKEHLVEHIHFTAQPDHSVPTDPEAIRALLGMAIEYAGFITD